MTTLADEARYLHHRFFPGPLELEVVDRYIEANRVCLTAVESYQSGIMHKIVSRRLDPVAVEVALRWRGRDSLLTKKIQILFYLLEVRSRYYPFFVNQERRRCHAVLALAGSVLFTLYAFLKGSYLVWRHRLV